MTNAQHPNLNGLGRDDAHHRLAAETELVENYLAVQDRIDNSDPALLKLQRDVQASFVAQFRQLAEDDPDSAAAAHSKELSGFASAGFPDDWQERWDSCVQASAWNKGEFIVLERLKNDNRAEYTARNRQLEEAWEANVADNHRLTAETWALRAERGI
jgi:hypothetical protein